MGSMKKKMPKKKGKVQSLRFEIEKSISRQTEDSGAFNLDYINTELDFFLYESKKRVVFMSLLKNKDEDSHVITYKHVDAKKKARQNRASIESWDALKDRMEKNIK